MALTPEQQAAVDRLEGGYNGNAYDVQTNPLGFARGGNQMGNFIASLRDLAIMGRLVSTAKDLAARFEAAVSAIEAGPVSSVVGQSGAVTADQIKTAIGFDALAEDLRQDVEDAIAAIPVPPTFKPITMTVPAAGATNVGAGGTYAFVVQAFAGDTAGYYPDYPVPLASRFVDVFEPGGNAAVKRFTVSGTGVAFPVSFTGSGLLTSHEYEFQAGYIAADGSSVLSQRVRATTAAVFKPSVGQPYQGGFLAVENWGDGELSDLVVASKSTEASKTWYTSASDLALYSRLNGRSNTDRFKTQSTSTTFAAPYADSISIGGVAGYLGAVDQLRAISFNLRPANAVEAAFKAGGSEAFQDANYWSSTEISDGNAFNVYLLNGTANTAGKPNGNIVRAIKSVAVTPPVPLGTYLASQGGWLAAYFTDMSSGTPVTVGLIVSDKATEVTRTYDDGTNLVENPARKTRTDGVSATNNVGPSAAYPAANYCFNLVHGGKDDWYLGAIDEMVAISRMNEQLPSAQQLFSLGNHWSSTEVDAGNARRVRRLAGPTYLEGTDAKTSALAVRAIRRVPLSQLAA